MESSPVPPTVVEVFADVCCPFTHVGLRRFVAERARRSREDVLLRVRCWPLEIVNGTPLDPALIAEEVDELRSQVAPELFVGFRADRFPPTSMPALALAAHANGMDLATGEAVSLALRDELFERGRDVSSPEVLADVAERFALEASPDGVALVRSDHAEGVARGVIGSPHFFTVAGDFFCPALDIARDDHGQLRIDADPVAFDQFLDACFG